MHERYLISDTLIAWYGSHKNGRQLQGLSIFTQTIDSFNPAPAASRFKDWLVCSSTASGVTSELIATGPAGHFDSLLQTHQPWFSEGNLISCPIWEYRVCAPPYAAINEVAAGPGPGPDLGTVIKKLGI